MYIKFIIACDISDDGFKSLSNSLSCLSNLNYLNISDNKITENGFGYITNSFRYLSNLKCLLLKSIYYNYN